MPRRGLNSNSNSDNFNSHYERLQRQSDAMHIYNEDVTRISDALSRSNEILTRAVSNLNGVNSSVEITGNYNDPPNCNLNNTFIDTLPTNHQMVFSGIKHIKNNQVVFVKPKKCVLNDKDEIDYNDIDFIRPYVADSHEIDWLHNKLMIRIKQQGGRRVSLVYEEQIDNNRISE